MDKKQEIDALIARYEDGTCTPEERELVERLFFKNTAGEGLEPDMAIYQEALWSRLRPVLQVKRKPVYPWYLSAAALLIIGCAIYFARVSGGGSPLDEGLKLSEILPATSKATLTLVGGKEIALKENRSGIIVKGKNIQYDDGTNVLDQMGKDAGAQGAPEASELLLSTPRAGQYQVILSDGTKVWLNAASSLRYPSRFTGNNRTVEVEGEAYFDVAQQKEQPFIVISKHQKIRVIGTEFNIKSYDDEPNIETTLVRGGVEVSLLSGRGNVLRLMPEDQSVLSRSGILTKERVNLEDAVAWKNGRFNFEGKSLKHVMNELSRWYDLDIVYEGNVPDLEFFGGIQRNKNLSMVLKLLENNEIGYRLESGRKLVISNVNR